MKIDPDYLLFLTSATIGDGEPDLGEKLMGAFLKMVVESGTAPARVICMNSAVFLTTEGSAVLESLRALAAVGTEVLSCGTCLDYYGRKAQLQVGAPTNMRDTVQALHGFKKVIRP